MRVSHVSQQVFDGLFRDVDADFSGYGQAPFAGSGEFLQNGRTVSGLCLGFSFAYGGHSFVFVYCLGLLSKCGSAIAPVRRRVR